MKNQTGRELGFTLMETAIAMLVMMIAGLGAVGLFAYAVRNNAGATDRAFAVAIAQEQVEKLRNLPFTHSELAATSTAGTTTAVKHGALNSNQGRVFSVKRIITNEVIGGITRAKIITVEVAPADGAKWSRGTVRVMTRRTSSITGPYL